MAGDTAAGELAGNGGVRPSAADPLNDNTVAELAPKLGEPSLAVSGERPELESRNSMAPTNAVNISAAHEPGGKVAGAPKFGRRKTCSARVVLSSTAQGVELGGPHVELVDDDGEGFAVEAVQSHCSPQLRTAEART